MSERVTSGPEPADQPSVKKLLGFPRLSYTQRGDSLMSSLDPPHPAIQLLKREFMTGVVLQMP